MSSFGICVLDASTGEFNLTVFDDDICRTRLETMFRQIRPKELVHAKVGDLVWAVWLELIWFRAIFPCIHSVFSGTFSLPAPSGSPSVSERSFTRVTIRYGTSARYLRPSSIQQ